MARKEFEEVSIPKWNLIHKESEGKFYRVYKNPKEFEEVEASSANEAMQKAGFEDVFEVRIGKIDDVEVLDNTLLSEAQEEAPVEEGTEVPQDIADEMPLEASTEAASAQPSPTQ